MKIQYLNEWIDTEEVTDDVTKELSDEELATSTRNNAREIIWKKKGLQTVCDVIESRSSEEYAALQLLFNPWSWEPKNDRIFLEKQRIITLRDYNNISIDNLYGHNSYSIDYDPSTNKINIVFFGSIDSSLIQGTNVTRSTSLCTISRFKFRTLVYSLKRYLIFINRLTISLLDEINSLKLNIKKEDINIEIKLFDDRELSNLRIAWIHIDISSYGNTCNDPLDIKEYFLDCFTNPITKDILNKYMNFKELGTINITFSDTKGYNDALKSNIVNDILTLANQYTSISYLSPGDIRITREDLEKENFSKDPIFVLLVKYFGIPNEIGQSAEKFGWEFKIH